MPSVRPSYTPERISTASSSSRCVTSRLCPGRRRSRSCWMSATSSASRGGQPSTTTPTPPPCDSPKVVTRKSVPNVLAIDRQDREHGVVLGHGVRRAKVGPTAMSAPHFHVPEPPARPARRPTSRTSTSRPPGRWTARRSTSQPATIRHLAYALIRVLDDDGRAPSGRGRPTSTTTCCAGPAGDGDDARVRRAHGAGAASGQDVVLHALHGRGGVRRRPRARPGAGRHVLPELPAAGLAGGPRLAARRPDVPDLLQRARPPARPATAGAVLGARRRVLHRVGQPRHPVRAGGGLGDGRRHQGRLGDRLGRGRRRHHGRGRLPPRPHVRPHLPGAGGPQRGQQPVGDLDVPGRRRRRRRRHVRGRGPSASASPPCASTATTSSPSSR